MNRYKQMGVRALPYLACLALGYFVAVLAFRQKVTVDVESGRVFNTCYLFPFTITTELQDRAFELIFPMPSDCNKRELVDVQGFVNLFGTQREFVGGLTVEAENKLAYTFIKTRLTPSERADKSRRFFESLKLHGPSGAMEFAESELTTSNGH
jgi:hypothetical protein